jgi:hypothetical protein
VRITVVVDYNSTLLSRRFFGGYGCGHGMG